MALPLILERLEQGGLGLLVEQGGRLRFASDRAGLDALRDATLDHASLLDGADLALDVLGMAGASLAILANAGRVYARTYTYEARDALAEEGIEVEGGRAVRTLSKSLAAPMADLDCLARESVTPEAFLDELKRLRY